MWVVHWAAWMQTDPTETMQIFENGTAPTAKAGALGNDHLPVATMTIEDDGNDSNDKVGRNVIPTGRNDTDDPMTAINAVGNTLSATNNTTTTSTEPTARHVKFCDQCSN